MAKENGKKTGKKAPAKKAAKKVAKKKAAPKKQPTNESLRRAIRELDNSIAKLHGKVNVIEHTRYRINEVERVVGDIRRCQTSEVLPRIMALQEMDLAQVQNMGHVNAELKAIREAIANLRFHL